MGGLVGSYWIMKSEWGVGKPSILGLGLSMRYERFCQLAGMERGGGL